MATSQLPKSTPLVTFFYPREFGNVGDGGIVKAKKGFLNWVCEDPGRLGKKHEEGEVAFVPRSRFSYDIVLTQKKG